jgi:hypothetical protein
LDTLRPEEAVALFLAAFDEEKLRSVYDTTDAHLGKPVRTWLPFIKHIQETRLLPKRLAA